MGKKTIELHNIEYDHAISQYSDKAFWNNLQAGLLLALREQNILTDLQLRQAEEILRRKGCRR